MIPGDFEDRPLEDDDDTEPGGADEGVYDREESEEGI